jgi:hypothetical protein
LVEIGPVVPDDFKVDTIALDGDQVDVSAVKGARY